MMKPCVLYYNADNPGAIFAGVPANRGVEEVLKRLEALKLAGVQVVNTASFTAEERRRAYTENTAWPAAVEHYRVRVCFGRGGLMFGNGVPALAVMGEDGLPEHIFPHADKNIPSQYITISDYFLHHGGLPQ